MFRSGLHGGYLVDSGFLCSEIWLSPDIFVQLSSTPPIEISFVDPLWLTYSNFSTLE